MGGDPSVRRAGVGPKSLHNRHSVTTLPYPLHEAFEPGAEPRLVGEVLRLVRLLADRLDLGGRTVRNGLLQSARHWSVFHSGVRRVSGRETLATPTARCQVPNAIFQSRLSSCHFPEHEFRQKCVIYVAILFIYIHSGGGVSSNYFQNLLYFGETPPPAANRQQAVYLIMDAQFDIRERWEGAVTSGETGFVAVPNVLLRSQAHLGVSAVEVVVLVNILMHWWRAHEWPHPRMSAIAKRMGTSPRTVQRAVQRLEDKQLVKRLASESLGKRRGTVQRFDLSGLIERLRHLTEQKGRAC